MPRTIKYKNEQFECDVTFRYTSIDLNSKFYDEDKKYEISFENYGDEKTFDEYISRAYMFKKLLLEKLYSETIQNEEDLRLFIEDTFPK